MGYGVKRDSGGFDFDGADGVRWGVIAEGPMEKDGGSRASDFGGGVRNGKVPQ